MAAVRKPAHRPPPPDPYKGKRVRISCEGEAVAHYPAGPTAPERISVVIGGIFTIVPVANVKVVG